MKVFQVSWVFLVLVFIGNILIMNKSQRIYLSSGDTGNDNQDKYIRVKLEQDVETLEFMSLSLGTADVYQNFNADYGVLVGRVLANGGIGVPNAKISIFINSNPNRHLVVFQLKKKLLETYHFWMFIKNIINILLLQILLVTT